MPFSFLHFVLNIQSKVSRKMHLVKPQVISFLEFREPVAPILDIGGGGAGVIGQLYTKNVTAIDLRQDELDEAPEGPKKVCADARDLPFEDASFPSVTAFYFLMYLLPQDIKQVLRETYRCLQSNGTFFIWDTVIPKRDTGKQTLFTVPVQAILPHKTISTAYGVSWEKHVLEMDDLVKLLEEVGFSVKERSLKVSAFYLKCQK